MIRILQRWARASLVALVAVMSPGLVASAGAAIIRVNTLADVVNAADGLCSLREAITASNVNAASGAAAGECAAGSAFPTRDIIRFPGLNGTIAPAAANGPLPTLTNGRALIDGWSAAGAGPGLRPRIRLNGALLGPVDNGITINSPKNHVRGLAVVNFYNGIRIEGANAFKNRIYGNIIGANLAGIVAQPNNTGISISSGATDNIVGTNGDGVRDAAEMNLISGNQQDGVSITSLGTERNRVAGNRIGTNLAGTAALPNSIDGIAIGVFAANNIIGTDSSGDPFDAVEGNLISGNGIGINQFSGSDTIIAGNLIGLNAAGDAAIPNGLGIQILDSVSGLRIGTDGDGVSDDFERNVISGNTSSGIDMRGTDHQVAGNYIGTDITGTFAVANGLGISADIGPLLLGANMTIGGIDGRFRNVISGNAGTGVEITAANVTVQCNAFGTDVGGTLPVGNVIAVNVTAGLNATITGNFFSFNSLGVSATPNTTIAVANYIAGNTDGATWGGVGNMDITDNWWGDASGPSIASNPGGTGDTLFESGGGTALYTPWLAVEPTVCGGP